MQPSTPFDWGRAVPPARWIAAMLGGIGFVGWAIWSIVLAANETATIDVVQWVVWGAIGVDLAIAMAFAMLRQGNTELVAGVVLIAAAGALGVVSGFAGPAILAVPLVAIAGALFAACGQYDLTHERSHAPADTRF